MKGRETIRARVKLRRPRRPMPPPVRVHGPGKDRRCRRTTRELLEEALGEWEDEAP